MRSIGSTILMLFMAGSSAAIAQESTMRPDSLHAIDRNRASIVKRIVDEWSPAMTGASNGRALSREALAEALWQLRADRLLAASLAGDVDALLALVETTRSHERSRDPLTRRAAEKALGDAAADLVYTPVNPCRILDTRVTGGALAANVARTFDGFAANFSAQGGTATSCGIPNGVAALAMNVYAVNPTNLGFIKVWPANGAEPAVSTVNYQVGITAIATGALVPVDAGNSNRFTAKSPAIVDFIADVVGYFKAPGDAAGLDIKVAGQRVMRYEFNAVSPNVIGGSPANSVTAGVRGATIAGGGVPAGNSDPDYADEAPNRVTDAYGTVGGGYANRAGNDAGTVIDRGFATVGGGGGNIASGLAATIVGGVANAASGTYSTVGGGRLNVASSESATVGGGESNTASGGLSTVPGGLQNSAVGDLSFAAGVRAKANHERSFVWGGSTIVDTTTAAAGDFVVYAPSRVRLFAGTVGTGGCEVGTGDVGGNLSCAGTISATVINQTSDRALKSGVVAVDPQVVLERVVAMPIAEWSFAKTPDVRHIGPMAQDFHAAFGLGHGDTTIATVDADGIALAAIQGLNRKLASDVEALRARNDSLEKALADLAAEVRAIRSNASRD